MPGGYLNPQNCEVHDGIKRVAIQDGTISYRRTKERGYGISLNVQSDGKFVLISPIEISEDKLKITYFDGIKGSTSN